MPLIAVFDFDQTLCDTSSLAGLRAQRDWARCRARGAKLPFFAGIRNVLGELRASGTTLGIASSSPGNAYLAPFLRRLDVPFDFVLDYFAARALPKPAGAAQRAAMKAAQLHEVRRRYPHGVIVFVGDDEDDAEGARLAGVTFVHACFGAPCDAIAGEHANSTDELARAIRRLGRAA